MVYLLVGVTLLCLSVKGYCGKRVSCAVRNTGDSFLFNSLRMLLCILIGAALVLAEGVADQLLPEWEMLLICLFSGAANAAFLVFWLFAVQKNAMVSVDVGLTLGSLLPSLLCAWLFGEAISLPKMLGFALILLATLVLAGHSKKTGVGPVGVILLVLASLGDGLIGFSQQLYLQLYTEAGTRTHGVFYAKTVFHFYTYVFAALILIAVLTVYRLRERKKAPCGASDANSTRLSIPPRVLLYITLMAVSLFVTNYLQTVVTGDYGMPSQVLYPILKGGALITVSLYSAFFFGEKITPRSVCGILIALVGIVCMSLL